MSQDKKGDVYWPDGLVERIEHKHTGTCGENFQSLKQKGEVTFVEPGEMSISWGLHLPVFSNEGHSLSDQNTFNPTERGGISKQSPHPVQVG